MKFQHATHRSVNRAVYQAYGCKRSTWHPKQPIEMLMEQLELNGPHLVAGLFGKHCYTKPATLKISASSPAGKSNYSGRNIHAWNAGERLPIEASATQTEHSSGQKKFLDLHAVVVVGAEITSSGSQLVYYQDPRDGAKKGDPTSQKIYAISYKTFTTHLANIVASQLTSLDQVEGNATGPNDYAIAFERQSSATAFTSSVIGGIQSSGQ